MRHGTQWFLVLALAGLVWFGESPSNAGGEQRPPTVSPRVWTLGSWKYRIPITVKPDSIQGNGSLLDFSVLLRLGPAEASVFAGANANGSDLLVTKADGTTVLGHQVVSFDPVLQQAEIWFRADTLSKAVHRFYLYYGNASQTTFPSPGTAWNSKYVAVYHFAENPGSGVLKDWGPRANDANAAVSGSNWTSSDVIAGQIGQAWNFNGTTHFIQANAISTPDSTFVISAWLKLPSRTTDFTFQANPGFWHVSAQINETHRMPHFNAANPWRDLRWGPNPLPTDDLFHYFTWVMDGDADTILFYYDGVQQPATPWSLDPPQKHFYTGTPINPNHNQGVGVLGPIYWNSFDLMTGPGDEFHLSERTHSAEWIRTEYRNQRDPAGFFALGAEETSDPVAVEVLYFRARRDLDTVTLDWETAGELGLFRLYRGFDEATRVCLCDQWLTGGPVLSYVDAHAPRSAISYWLLASDRTGNSAWYGPVHVAGLDTRAIGGMNMPNPFRGSTRFTWSMPDRGSCTVAVFDLGGRVVRTVLSGTIDAGVAQTQWDGRDDAGRRVPPGIYYARIVTPAASSSWKMTLLPE